jgi:glycosyltransferase involved in cell wall biosynthesis
MTADAVGGVWTYALDLARELTMRGVTIDLATMGPAPSAAQLHEAERAGVRVTVGPFRLEWMDDPWEDVDRAGEWLLDLERSIRPDLVHLNGYSHGALPWRAPVLMVGHSCVLSWWRAVYRTEAPDRFDEYRWRVRCGLQAASMAIAPSRAMLASLAEDYGPFARCRVIANGRERVRLQRRRQSLLLSAGRIWDQGKNIGAVTRIAGRVRWPVYIAGENAGDDAIAAANVHHLGHVPGEAMRGWFARAAVYVLPARYEPFGLSVLEAAHAGCALVLGNIPSLVENWEGAALFVPPDDSDELQFALSTLIDDEEMRRELAWRARCRARRFTVARMADEYLTAYEEMVREPRCEARGARSEIRDPRSEVRGPECEVHDSDPSPRQSIAGPQTSNLQPRASRLAPRTSTLVAS